MRRAIALMPQRYTKRGRYKRLRAQQIPLSKPLHNEHLQAAADRDAI
jgi:hypothetical protein